MQDEEHEQPETALCTNCAAPVPYGANFCEQCGCPLTFQAASMPYESVLAEGFIWRQGSSHPRRFVTVLGMWLVCGPSFLGCLAMFFWTLVESRGVIWQPDPVRNVLGALLVLGILAGGVVLWGALLYKTTRNYMRMRQAAEEMEEPDVEQA